jgi:hypothetical protein
MAAATLHRKMATFIKAEAQPDPREGQGVAAM